jgi:V/A-type H+-transporting ATPase subunit E
MGLEAVIDDIRQKGRSEADKITSETRQEVASILTAAQKRVEEIKMAADEEVEKQSAHMMEQDVSAAQLIVKRGHLNTQKLLLDQVYASALAELAALPESFHLEAIKKLLAEVHKEIESGTIYCSARDRNAVKEILEKGSAYKGYKLGNAVDIEGGIIVESTDSELQIDYSYRTFLDKVWESGLKDASDILFG